MFSNLRLAEDIRSWIAREGKPIVRRFPPMELILPLVYQEDDGNYIFRYVTDTIEADLLIWLKGEVNYTIANFPECLKNNGEIYSMADSCTTVEQVQAFASEFFRRLDKERSIPVES